MARRLVADQREARCALRMVAGSLLWIVSLLLVIGCNEGTPPTADSPAGAAEGGASANPDGATTMLTSGDDLESLARLLGAVLGSERTVDAMPAPPLVSIFDGGPPPAFDPFDGQIIAEGAPGPAGFGFGFLPPGWTPPPCGSDRGGLDVLCPPPGQRAEPTSDGYWFFAVDPGSPPPGHQSVQVTLGWHTLQPDALIGLGDLPDLALTAAYTFGEAGSGALLKNTRDESGRHTESLTTGTVAAVDTAHDLGIILFLPRDELPRPAGFRSSIFWSNSSDFAPGDTTASVYPDLVRDPVDVSDLVTTWSIRARAPEPEAPPEQPTRPTAAPTPIGALAVVSIAAFFDPPAQSTTYNLAIGGETQHSYYVRWSGPDCGTWEPNGWSLIGGPVEISMVWHHPHPPCDPTVDHQHVSVELLVFSLQNSAWRQASCLYQGAATGEGPRCTGDVIDGVASVPQHHGDHGHHDEHWSRRMYAGILSPPPYEER